MTKFISFYSYKGGVGRTLTLVNVAAALAKEGKSVIIWDLDLEAPGIQTFPLLNRFGIEEEVETGTVDIILDFQENDYQLKLKNEQIIRDSIYSFRSQKLTGIYKPLKNIRILPAGKLDEKYPAKYSQIKWDQLFDGKKNTGLDVFEWCYQVMADMNPDVVLVDSRTGLTNTSLVTTIQVPDLIYLVFNYNQQNLRGLNSIYKALISPGIQQDIRNFSLPVFPVASMVDFENIKLHQRRKKVLAEQYNIEPEYEIPFHKPLIMEEDILSLTDEHQTLEATKIYYEIAHYISSFEPERLEKKKPLKEKKTSEKKEQVRRKELHRIEKAKSFEQKVGEIFKLKGFDVEFNKEIAGNEIDIFLKKRKSIGNLYEYYICECKGWEQKVGRDVVQKAIAIKDAAKSALGNQNCEVMIIASRGFTDVARKTAKVSGITLYTYEELLSQLMDFDGYLTSLIQNFKGSPLYHLYIEQNFIPEQSMEEVNSFKFVEQWLNEPGRKHFSLLGDYGTGKTSFVRKLAYHMAVEYKEIPGSGRIPFLVDLRQCKGVLSLENLLHEQLQNAQIEPASVDIFLKLLSEGKILLIFDAFDEMATMSNAEITRNNFLLLNQAVTDDAKVLLTSRTHYFKDKNEADIILKEQGLEGLSQEATMLYREVSDKPEYEIIYLKEFSETQIKHYFQKAMGKSWQKYYEKIQSIYNLLDLACRPVLLEMIIKTLPKIEIERSEFNVVPLYEVYTYTWFEREDHRLQVTKKIKLELAEELAYKLWQKAQTRIHNTELHQILQQQIMYKITDIHEIEAAIYEVQTASFLVRDAEGNYSFAHRSFQEFFIARKIRKELLKKNFKILDLHRLSLAITFFLRHLMGNDDSIISDAAKFLETDYIKNISENAIVLFYNITKLGHLKQRFSLNDADIPFASTKIKTFKEKIQKTLPTKMNLQTAILKGSRFPYMIFAHADFANASLDEALLTNCDFESVSFKKAKLKGSDFSHSIFKNVVFEEVIANGTNFNSCSFENCYFLQSDFETANFIKTSFKSCIIKGNDFTNANFSDSNINLKGHPENKF